ncbi:hypothetical protein HDU97_006472 [Phlyctochytrium planicorne]|nr:hypothetical protein HDU97_006472 [Phlyctochytrium planicorne]
MLTLQLSRLSRYCFPHDRWQRMNPTTDFILHNDLGMVDLVVTNSSLFLRGGVYVDSDVFLLRPLDAWTDHFDLYVDDEEGKSEKAGGDGKVFDRIPPVAPSHVYCKADNLLDRVSGSIKGTIDMSKRLQDEQLDGESLIKTLLKTLAIKRV